MLWLMLSTGLSTGALVFSLLALWISRQKLSFPRRKLNDLELQIGDLDHDIASLRSTTKRLNARIGMREARESKKDDAQDSNGGVVESDNVWDQRPNETPAQWKARLRRGPLLRGAKPPGVK